MTDATQEERSFHASEMTKKELADLDNVTIPSDSVQFNHEVPEADRRLGIDQDLFTVPEDVNASLPDDIVRSFEGK